MDRTLWEKGLNARKSTLGAEYVEKSLSTADDFNKEFQDMLNEFCGDILHGDLFAIIWRDGLLQLTAHFKSAYFHTWPKPVPAFPVLYFRGE